jgi:hypothetical protein
MWRGGGKDLAVACLNYDRTLAHASVLLRLLWLGLRDDSRLSVKRAVREYKYRIVPPAGNRAIDTIAGRACSLGVSPTRLSVRDTERYALDFDA